MPSTNIEQYILELINEVRLDPAAGSARLVSSFAPLTATQANIQAALDFFGVSGAALQSQLSALTPAAPLAYNNQLASAARAHNAAMIAADQQTHQAPGEPDLSSRLLAAGYDYRLAGENVYAYAEDPLFGHAGLFIDWGPGPNGIQAPPGHRDNIMNPELREVGIGVTVEGSPSTQVGPYVITQDFGSRGGTGVFLLGVAYGDIDGDSFYSVGEGRSGLTVTAAGGASTTTSDSGGYSLAAGAGPAAVTLSGGGLASPVVVYGTFADGQNVKLDVVNGNTLQLSASATITGTIGVIRGLGTVGLILTTDDFAHTLVGTSGHDVLSTGAGNDVLQGGAGNDLLFGNAGNDVLLGGSGLNQLWGGDGVDSASYAGTTASVYADLRGGGGAHVGGVLTDTYNSIENLTGGLGNDLLVGDDGANVLNGGAGANQLFGFGGEDRFIGGTASPGVQNQLFGGDGSDTVDYSAFTADVYAELRAPAGYVAGQLTDLMNSVENVIGGSGNDTLVGTDIDTNLLSGGTGTDLLFGYGGDDVLTGGPASTGQYNQLWGGDGSDTASYAGTSATVYADLRVLAGWVSDGAVLVLTDVYNSVENLRGGASADTLIGDGGANRLTGGGGADILTGGAGADTFVFAATSESSLSTAYDTISDFQTGLDHIDLTALQVDATRILIASDGTSSALYADTDLASAGYEFAISFVGANAVTTNDLLL